MPFNDRTTPLSLLKTRRSGKPREMVAPGPAPDQLSDMIAAAARTPDHGKLFPWRFVTVPDAARAALAQRLGQILRAEKADSTDRDVEAAEQFALQAPALVIVLFAPIPGHKIPQWEQELSAGAVCMNLLHAAHAMGFVASWITGWAAYSPGVQALLGAEGERIAGFIFMGSPMRELEERPRPDLSAIVRTWAPDAGLDGQVVY